MPRHPKQMSYIFVVMGLFALWATSGSAAEIYILGEQHDNPAHHRVQAQWIERLNPKAVVFEMLDEDQEHAISQSHKRDLHTIRNITRWDDSGWPDFDLYAPIFDALGGAAILGAGVPRAQARAAFETGIIPAFGDDADVFGLTKPLDPEQQSAREAYQLAAHCDALPSMVLPAMVDIQRLRDAMLARRALQALTNYGPPIVVITGNGHARRDWGMPQYMTHANADIYVLGQGENGINPEGAFDEIQYSPPVDRDDPCAVFDKK